VGLVTFQAVSIVENLLKWDHIENDVIDEKNCGFAAAFLR